MSNSAKNMFKKQGLHDKQFSSIKDSLRKKKKEKNAEAVVMECYVDSTRMTAVNFTGGGDLKQLMGDKKILTEDEQNLGIAIDITYLKQAEHLLRTNAYQSAIKYTLKALELNPDSMNAMTLLARLYLVTNKWPLATEAADMVLHADKRSTKARLVKAEALFNVCQFEHAMVHFYRGMAASRDREQTEIFRLGVQKCRKIIFDCVPNDSTIFKGEGMDVLFKLLSNLYEGRELGISEKEALHESKKGPQLSFSAAMKMAATRKKMAKDAKENIKIKQEEELTKRNVKTILDEEVAEHERSKIAEKREKEGRKLDKINLMKKMNKVTKGASMATKVYEDALQTALNEASKKGRRGGVDRLKKDKRYLHSLSRQLTKRTDIPDDTVHDDVIAEAQGVLSFLKQRDMFWDQLQY